VTIRPLSASAMPRIVGKAMDTPTVLPSVECKNVWKIFGPRASEALPVIMEERLDKRETLRRFNCVLGVADASFSVSPGKIFCVMGLSGSGKSTLVRHINRLIEPTAGEIWVEGENVNGLNDRDLRALRSHRIGMVFQNMALLPHRNVRDNVALSLELRGMPRKNRYAIAEEKLALVSLDSWSDRFPHELSGGMKQRVGLARAMAADPDILLMDEPFSALDPVIRRQLQEQFLQLASALKKTTIFITHDLDEAIKLGDNIAIMKDGKIVQIGTPEDIIINPIEPYVADFVAGISRLGLVTARKIMEPAQGSMLSGSGPRAALDATLDDLINLACASDEPIRIMNGDTVAGVITKHVLLRGIQGHK
jgi:glycine betaine/proline transport system ATP-binding protein